MNTIIKASLCVLVLGMLLTSCEDDESTSEIDLPLSGVYSLTAMTISVEASTLRDTVITLNQPYNGSDTYDLMVGTLVLETSTDYSDQDETPISGTVTLENDGSANLSGFLPVNLGTACIPLTLITQLGSDGDWEADSTHKTFAIDMVTDALSIDGTYSLVGDQLEIRYFSIVDVDERTINSIPVDGNDLAILPTCIAVATTTERVLHLTKTE